jgi:hypothetical protein
MKNRKDGFALVLVITLVTAMLIFATFYIMQTKFTEPFNANLLTSLQANFLGQGVAQIVALKVKKLSGPLYYAMIAKNKKPPKTPFTDPYDQYKGDPLLNPNFTTPFRAVCNTEISMLPSTAYKILNFKVQVAVSVNDFHGRTFQRTVENVINGNIQW